MLDIERLRELQAKATPGPLVLATSNSWRRIVSAHRSIEVCVPCTQPDGHPDLYFPNGGPDGPDVTLLLEAWNALAALLDEIDALRAELQARQWRPIETAPKDGTEILAWRDDCGQFIASYTSPSAFPLTQAELDQTDEETLFAEDWFTQWPQALRLEGSECPTAWMPLPPAPPQGETQ